MDVLEIVIATIDLPLGPAPRAEIVVNGTSLTELIDRVDKPGGGYAPLVPEQLLPWMRQALAHPLAQVQVLGCTCGDDRCSYAHVVVRTDAETVRWERVLTGWRDQTIPIGPFCFDRARYEVAIASPREADEPLRDYSD
jgi:hypothetical protein